MTASPIPPYSRPTPPSIPELRSQILKADLGFNILKCFASLGLYYIMIHLEALSVHQGMSNLQGLHENIRRLIADNQLSSAHSSAEDIYASIPPDIAKLYERSSVITLINLIRVADTIFQVPTNYVEYTKGRESTYIPSTPLEKAERFQQLFPTLNNLKSEAQGNPQPMKDLLIAHGYTSQETDALVHYLLYMHTADTPLPGTSAQWRQLITTATESIIEQAAPTTESIIEQAFSQANRNGAIENAWTESTLHDQKLEWKLLHVPKIQWEHVQDALSMLTNPPTTGPIPDDSFLTTENLSKDVFRLYKQDVTILQPNNEVRTIPSGSSPDHDPQAHLNCIKKKVLAMSAFMTSLRHCVNDPTNSLEKLTALSMSQQMGAAVFPPVQTELVNKNLMMVPGTNDTPDVIDITDPNAIKQTQYFTGTLMDSNTHALVCHYRLTFTFTISRQVASQEYAFTQMALKAECWP